MSSSPKCITESDAKAGIAKNSGASRAFTAFRNSSFPDLARFVANCVAPRLVCSRAAKNPAITKKTGRRKLWIRIMSKSAIALTCQSLYHQTPGYGRVSANGVQVDSKQHHGGSQAVQAVIAGTGDSLVRGGCGSYGGHDSTVNLRIWYIQYFQVVRGGVPEQDVRAELEQILSISGFVGRRPLGFVPSLCGRAGVGRRRRGSGLPSPR